MYYENTFSEQFPVKFGGFFNLVFLVFLVQNEVIQALPKLIKLNPIVVKEVFNRLLGTQHSKSPSSLFCLVYLLWWTEI